MNNFLNIYHKSNNVEMVLKSSVFRKQGDTKPFIQKTATYYVSGNNFYYKIDQLITICSKDVLIQIDKESKRIILTKGNINTISDLKKELFKAYKENPPEIKDSITYVGESNGVRTYEVFAKNNIIEKTTYRFNTTNGYLMSIEYDYNINAKTGVNNAVSEFTTMNFNGTVSSSIFDISSYVTEQKDTYVLSSAYSSYKLQIIDQSEIEKYLKK